VGCVRFNGVVPSTSARALTLLSVLSTGATVAAADLAARLGVAERTLRRDVDTLRGLGYRIASTRGLGGGYRLVSGTRLPPLVLDEEQVVAIAVALQTVPAVLTGIGESSARALRTVRQVMPERLAAESDAFSVTAVPNYWEFPAPPVDAAVVRDVGAAVRHRHLLRAEYSPADAAPERLRLEPHDLVVWAGRWYLVAYALGSEEWRVLRLDRLRAGDPTWVDFAERARPVSPAELVKRTVDRGDTLAAWPCRGSAVLEVPPAAAAEFAPGGAVVERVDDARSRLRMGAWSWIGLAGLFITFGARMTKVEPAELRQAFATARERLAAIEPE